MNQSIHALAAYPSWIIFSGWVLVHSLWQVTLIAGFAAVVLTLLRQAKPNTRYLVATGALALMAGVPVLTAAWTTLVWTSSDRASILISPADSDSVTQAARPIGSSRDEKEIPAGKFTPTDPLLQQTEAARGWKLGMWANLFARHGILAQHLAPWFPWIVAAWNVGIAFFALRWIIGWRRVTRLRRSGRVLSDDTWTTTSRRLADRLEIRRSILIVESSLACVPTVIGWMRPMILVPTSMISGLTPAELEALLAHELAHIRRHDYLVNLLQSVVETIYFFHPCIWWLSSVVRTEREDCCDDVAVAVCGNRLVFAKALARMEAMRGEPNRLVLAATGGSLLRRIRRVVGHEIPRSGSWVSTAVASLILLVGLATAMSMALASTEPRAAISSPGLSDSRQDHETSESVPQTAGVRTHRPQVDKIDERTGASKSVLSGVTLHSGSASQLRSATLDMMYSNVLNYSLIPARVADSLQAVEIGTIDFGESAPASKSAAEPSIQLIQSFAAGTQKPTPNSPPTQILNHVGSPTYVADDVGERRDVQFTPYGDDAFWLPDHLAFYNINQTNQRRFRVVRIDRVDLGLGPTFGPIHALVLDDENSSFGVLGSDWARSVRGKNGEGFIWSANDGFFFAAIDAEGRMNLPSPDGTSADDDEPLPEFSVIKKDDDRVTHIRIPAIVHGRSSADLIKKFKQPRNFDPRDMPESIVDQETIVWAIPRWHIDIGMDADEIHMSLPEGSGLRAELSGNLVEVMRDQQQAKIIVTEGRVELIDSVGVVRASASADGGAPQLVIDCRMSSDEVVMVLRTNQADCPVQIKMNPDTGAEPTEGDPPHRAIRYEIRAADTAQQRPLEMKMQWHYDFRQLLDEAQQSSEPDTDTPSPENDSPSADLVRPAITESPSPRSSADDPFGPAAATGDLRLKLTTQTAKPAAGGPLLLKLEITNVGKTAQEYDPQYYSPFRAIQVTRADGTRDWRIGPTPQTSGSPLPCAPGETQTLWESVDASELYMLDEGEYAIRVAPGEFAPSNLPESNQIQVSMQAGNLPPFKLVLKKLQTRLPDGWELSTGYGAIFLSHSPTNLKKDVTTIQCWFSDRQSDGADLAARATSVELKANYLGKHELGHAHLAAPEHATVLWPNYVSDIRGALGLAQEQSNQDPSESEPSQGQPERPWAAAGRVTDDTGKPIAGAEIRAHCGMGTLRQTGVATSDADGRYELRFGPGFFSKDKTALQAATISVHYPGYFEQNLHRQGDLLAAYRLPEAWKSENKKPEDVFLPDKVRTIDFVLRPAASLRGRILDAEGRPASRVRIALVGDQMPPSSSVAAAATAAEDGSFEIHDIPTGFEFQIMVEPAVARSPWLAWTSGPLSFVADDSQAAHLKYRMGETPVDFSTQSLTLVLRGEGTNWKNALATSRGDPIQLEYDGLSNGDGTVISAGMASIELGK